MNHKNVSISKSILRLVGLIFVFFKLWVPFSVLWIIAEGLGILEEVVDKRKEEQ